MFNKRALTLIFLFNRIRITKQGPLMFTSKKCITLFHYATEQDFALWNSDETAMYFRVSGNTSKMCYSFLICRCIFSIVDVWRFNFLLQCVVEVMRRTLMSDHDLFFLSSSRRCAWNIDNLDAIGYASKRKTVQHCPK